MIENLKITDTTTEKFFQAPVGKNYAIYNILFTNVGVADSPFDCWLVKNGGVLSNDTLFLKAKNLTLGLVYNYNEKIFLGPGDKISFKLNSGTEQINIFVSYIEI
jgi:hypothetical protein